MRAPEKIPASHRRYPASARLHSPEISTTGKCPLRRATPLTPRRPLARVLGSLCPPDLAGPACCCHRWAFTPITRSHRIGALFARVRRLRQVILRQVIEESRHSDIENARDEVGRKS